MKLRTPNFTAALLSFGLIACLPISKTSDQNMTVESSNSPLAIENSASQQIQHVAVLGDSQSTGVYGQRLSDLIRFASKQRLSFFGAASSGRVGSWVTGGFTPIPAGAYFGCESRDPAKSCAPVQNSSKRTSSINSILQNFPLIDMFIITLGDNHFYDPASLRSEIPRLIKPILYAGSKCAFVTPTEGLGQFSNKLKVIDSLTAGLRDVEQAMGKTCQLIDSYTVGKDVLKNEADLQLMRNAVSADPMKLHPRGAGARLWAERVFDALVARNMLTPL